MWKPRGFFDHQNYIEKSTWKPRGFFDHRNYIEKVRGNDVEIRQRFGLRRIDVISTSNGRGFHVVCPLGYLHKKDKKIIDDLRLI